MTPIVQILVSEIVVRDKPAGRRQVTCFVVGFQQGRCLALLAELDLHFLLQLLLVFPLFLRPRGR